MGKNDKSDPVKKALDAADKKGDKVTQGDIDKVWDAFKKKGK